MRTGAGRRFYRQTQSQLPEFVRERGVLFIHIPKTAGLSLTHALYGREIGHRKLCDFLSVNPLQTSGIFKFAVVRNPWDRLLSAYTYLHQGGDGSSTSDRLFRYSMLRKYDTFEKFVKRWLSRNSAFSYFHFEPQYTYVTDPNGKIGIESILRFEHLAHELEGIRQELGQKLIMGCENKSNRRDYSSYYDKKMIDIVASVYEKDCAEFDYKFEQE